MTVTSMRGRRGVLAGGLALLGFAWVGLAAVAQEVATRSYRPELPAGLDLYMPVPEDNPLTPARVALGRRLFFDPVLSRDGTVVCATCHDPRRVFTDGLPHAIGIDGRVGHRHVPTLVNRGYGRAFFWDGRAGGLEEQALQPIDHPDEFGSSVADAIARLQERPAYVAEFRSAFGRDPNPDDVARALAGYVRTILSGDAPIDRFVAGDAAALTADQRSGLRLFRGRGNCTACHFGPTFSDEQFHNTGIAFRSDGPIDLGRFDVTGDDADRGRFKTPTLREVARTAPYMHDGSFATLEDIVEFYDQGGHPNPGLDGEVRPLHLTADEKRVLVVFLGALSGRVTEGQVVAR